MTFNQAQDPSSRSQMPYSNQYRLTVTVVVLFGMIVLLRLTWIATDYQLFQAMKDIAEISGANSVEIEAINKWQFWVGVLAGIFGITTIVMFLIWTYRVHRNLPSLGAADLEFSPRSAVGWYFCPLLNLFKPYQAMREIVNASNPKYLSLGGSAWSGRNAPTVVRAWWALFLIMNVVSRAVGSAQTIADTPSSFQFVAVASMVDNAIAILAAVVAARVVWLVHQRQRHRAAALGQV